MAKLTLTRIDVTIFDKKERKSSPARFYVRPTNEINMSIFNSLKRSLFGSKYGSTTVHSISTTPAVNSGGEQIMVNVYNRDLGKEEETALSRLDKFSTGYNPNGDDKSQDYVIQLNSVSFKTTSKDGKEYYVEKHFERDFKGENPGVITNLEALNHMNLSVKDDATCEASIEKHENGTYYISKFAE